MKEYSSIAFILLVSTSFVGVIQCLSHYTIVAPESIRPQSEYQISLTLHDGIAPSMIQLSIEDGASYRNAKNVTLNSDDTKLVTLFIGDLDLSQGYKFVAEGLTNLRFKNESELKVQSKNVSLFIQTDKAIYKPGETVRFRVLVVDSLLRPVMLKETELLNVFITDPESNRIRQWKNVQPVKGVMSGEIELAKVPLFGDWSITAIVGEEKKIKKIEVAEYVLPKFDVKIEAPKHVTAKDGKVRAVIRSKYTYGKPVKGEAIVSMKRSQYHYHYRGDTEASVLKTIPIDGKGEVEFDVQDDLKLELDKFSLQTRYEIKATVIEELTGRNYSATEHMTIHRDRYKVAFHNRDDRFVPGLPIIFTISVTHQDDAPILYNDETKLAKVGRTSDQHTDKEETEYFDLEFNRNGTGIVRVKTGVKDRNFGLSMKYMGEEHNLGYFYAPTYSEPSEFSVKVLTKHPKLHSDVFVEVESKRPMTKFTYQLVAHGKLLHAETVSVPERKYHVFKFVADFHMVPKATLIVHQFKNDEIISTTTDVNIADDLNNDVKLKLSTTQTKPGLDVEISLMTKRDSLIGLAAVDHSVSLLKENKGLTKDDAFGEIDAYAYHYHNINKPGPWIVPRRYHNYIDFSRNDMIIFTNAKQRHEEFSHFHNKVLQMPMASLGAGMRGAALPGAPPSIPAPRIRTEFPETWIWELIDAENLNGSVSITRKVPDTITSWSLSAFALSREHGLGLTKAPKMLQVSQPFFISMNIPYSVKSGEVVAIPAVIFNYFETDVDALVTMHNENGEFEFVGAEGQKEIQRQVHVQSGGGISENFMVRFNAVGIISIKVTAVSPLAGDGVVRVLHVEPEGVAVHENKPIFIDLRTVDQLKTIQTIDVPANAVPDSLHVSVSAVGNLLGGTVKNLHSLIRLPTGCGEQNLLKFVPNVLILDYLKATDELTPSIESKALRFLSKGYQSQLTYRHLDGSFSSFGKLDSEGSVWLTSFVLKSFLQARKYIDVDFAVSEHAQAWLKLRQNADGSFTEIGDVPHQVMKREENKNVALTAYVAIALLQDETRSDRTVAERAVEYVAAQATSVSDIYTNALAAYALQLGEHPSRLDVLNALLSKSIVNDDKKWWSHTHDQPNSRPSKTLNIEITSYGLLALIKAERAADGLPYFKWLLSQRNDQGGFEGSQDTVIGLEALSKYAMHLSSKNHNIKIVAKSNAGETNAFDVDVSNALLLQSYELKTKAQSIEIDASGHGFALFQIAYRYHVKDSESKQSFSLQPTLKITSPGHIVVDVCATFKPNDNEIGVSNMVVMEVALPSGFSMEKETIDKLLHANGVKLVETKRGETTANIYFEKMEARREVCVSVEGFRVHKVAEQKPVAVRIYDYYDSSRSAREFYAMPPINSCEICEGQECSKICNKN